MLKMISEVTILCFICLAAIMGNVSLFLIVYKNPNLRTITNMFILNLAAADILVSMLSMPVTIITIVNGCWVFGHTACVVLGYFTMLSFIASVMSLGMIAINRYFYIVKWNTYTINFTKTKALLYAAGVWFLSMSLASPPLLGWAEYRFIPGKSYCFVYWPSNIYFMYFMITVCFFGPLLVMAFSYYNILNFTRNLKMKVEVLRDNLTPPPLQQQQEPEKKDKAQEKTAPIIIELDGDEIERAQIEMHNCDNPGTIKVCSEADRVKSLEIKSQLSRNVKWKLSPEEEKMTNTFLLVLALFIICWAPFAITMFFDVYYPRPLPRVINIVSLLLGYLNSMCNPILYGMRNAVFKQGFVNLYSWLIPKRLALETLGSKNDSGWKKQALSELREATNFTDQKLIRMYLYNSQT